MSKTKNIEKAERCSLNIRAKLLESLRVSVPEVFSEGRINWDKIRLALGECIEAASEKFNFTWAGKAGAVTNVLIPSKATLRTDKKDSVKFETSENLFIEGDNLEALKLLQKPYFEKVKMIYIDPPHNTGKNKVYKAADSERELLICLDEKISAGAIDALTDKEYKEKIFICFDAALTDSDKANLGFNRTLKTI